MDDITIVIMGVVVLVAWALWRLRGYKKRLELIDLSASHPAIVNAVGDLDSITTIKMCCDAEHFPLRCLWVPFAYACVAMLALLATIVSHAPDMMMVVATITSMMVATLLTKAITLDVRPAWILAAFIVIDHAMRSDRTCRDFVEEFNEELSDVADEINNNIDSVRDKLIKGKSANYKKHIKK